MLTCTLSQPFMIAESVRACCSITHLIVEPLLNAILISAVIDVRQLGICLSYHRHPHASHHCDSYNFTVFIMSFRIAIWNRQRIVSFLSVCIWLAGIATISYSTFCVPNFVLHVLISRACICEDMTMVRQFCTTPPFF